MTRILAQGSPCGRGWPAYRIEELIFVALLCPSGPNSVYFILHLLLQNAPGRYFGVMVTEQLAETAVKRETLLGLVVS